MSEQPLQGNQDDLVEPRPVAPENEPSLDTARIVQDTEALTPKAEPDHTEPGVVKVPPQGWNVLAIISLVLALTASPLTVIFGYLAVGQIRRANQKGEALAWTAVGLGWLWLVAWVAAVVIAALVWFEL